MHLEGIATVKLVTQTLLGNIVGRLGACILEHADALTLKSAVHGTAAADRLLCGTPVTFARGPQRQPLIFYLSLKDQAHFRILFPLQA